MAVNRTKFFIYPEVQKPLLRQVIFTVISVSLLQGLFIYLSVKWFEKSIQADLSVIIDYRILAAWRLLLFLSIFFPLVLNFIVTMVFILITSNKFAGPLFNLERELDDYLSGKKDHVNIQFRKNDYLLSLAKKINAAIEKSREQVPRV